MNDVFSFGEQGLNQTITTDYIYGQYLGDNPYPPTPSAASGYSNENASASQNRIVRKFDGANGFTYYNDIF